MTESEFPSCWRPRRIIQGIDIDSHMPSWIKEYPGFVAVGYSTLFSAFTRAHGEAANGSRFRTQTLEVRIRSSNNCDLANLNRMILYHNRTIQKPRQVFMTQLKATLSSYQSMDSQVKDATAFTPAQDTTMMRELMIWKNRYGHFRIAEGLPLASWLRAQLAMARNGTLPRAKLNHLRQIGALPSDRPDDDKKWQACFERLVELRALDAEHKVEPYLIRSILSFAQDQSQGSSSDILSAGEGNSSEKQELKDLLLWICRQRAAWRNFNMSLEREQKLSFELSINLEMCERDAVWDDRLLELLLFQERMGHCRVPLEQQYVRRSKNGLDSNAAEFKNWSGPSEAPKNGLYSSNRTDTDVEAISDLGMWLKNQRRIFLCGNGGTSRRQALLLCLGLCPKVQTGESRVRWSTRYEQLKEFKAKYGHVDPQLVIGEFFLARRREKRVEIGPQEWELRKLARWVLSQREQKLQQSLSSAKESKLNELGFAWTMPHRHRVIGDAKRYSQPENQETGSIQPNRKTVILKPQKGWLTQYSRLLEFKEKHGHVDVPRDYDDLGAWVSQQRSALSRNMLSRDRYEKLLQTGLCWNLQGEKWMKMYNAYKDHLSKGQPLTRSLVYWISRQRDRFDDQTLETDRIGMLRELNVELDRSKLRKRKSGKVFDVELLDSSIAESNSKRRAA